MKTARIYSPQDFLSPGDSPRGAHHTLDVELSIEDMEVRAGLCCALADLSESMRALLGLMARHNFITVLPDQSFPAYENVMDRIGTAVSSASKELNRSRDLDRRIALASLPTPAIFRQ